MSNSGPTAPVHGSEDLTLAPSNSQATSLACGSYVVLQGHGSPDHHRTTATLVQEDAQHSAQSVMCFVLSVSESLSRNMQVSGPLEVILEVSGRSSFLLQPHLCVHWCISSTLVTRLEGGCVI